eukprot:s787_g7.t1
MLLTRIALSLHALTCVALAGGCTSECDDSGMLQTLPGTALVEGAGIRPRFRGRGSGRLGRLRELARQRGGSRRFVRGSGKLFISAEAHGFVDMRKENEIPFLRGKFTTAALIYLTVSQIGMADFYAEAQHQTKATARVRKNNPGLQIEYWLQFDTDQHDSTPTSSCATAGATSCATYIKEYIEKTNLQLNSKVAGIHFDNEGVGANLQAIVEAWDQVRSELGVKISFTKGIGNCGAQTIFGVRFDYCLGQSYTDDTAEIYVKTPCGGINTEVLWQKWAGKVTIDGYSVPMLCAGGNCQGDLPGFLVSHGGPCNIDERLSTSGIADVVQSIDISLYPNMALWYGSGVEPQICPRCTADEDKVDLSGVDCNLLTAVIDCNYPSPVLCTKVLVKCEGPEWQKEGWSTYCKANGKCHFSQVKPPTPCSEFRMEIEACKSLSRSSLWGFGAGACSFNNPDLHPIPLGPMQDFVDEQVSTNYTYLGGSKITNCTPDGLLCTHGDGHPSAKNLGACQRQLGGMGQLLDENADEYQDICDVDEDLKKNCGGSCLRGMCLDKLPPAPAAGALKMPKILLYHGGIVGAPAFSTPCYKQYLDDVLRFVIEKNINTILLNVMAPIPKSTSHDAQFPYYEDPAWIAANFLDRLPPSVKAGALFGNVKLDSSGWNFQNSSFNIYKDKLFGGAGLGLAPGCTGHDLSKCSCSDLWVVAHVGEEDYVVVTPDEDIYTEQLSILNTDLKSIRVRPGPGRVPPGVNAAHVYALPAWSAAEKARLKAAADAEAVAEKNRRAPAGALAVAVAAPPAAPVVAAAVGAPQASGADIDGPGARGLSHGVHVWVAAESSGIVKFGDPVPGVTVAPSANAKTVHTLADGSQIFCQCISLAEMEEFNAKPVKMDSRLNKVKLNPLGSPERPLAEVVAETVEYKVDWKIAGPRTSRWCLSYLVIEGLGFEAHHERFRQLCKLDVTTWGVMEHFQLSMILRQLIQVDMVNGYNCLGIELIFRRLQTIEYAHSEKAREAESKSVGGKLTLEEQFTFGSMVRQAGTLMIAPILLEHVKAEVEKDVLLQKNLRKAREERELARKAKGQKGSDP